ncbi:MAG: CDP-alcohol phosphatidyltransferase family protein [Candidatus Nanopelagicaceae bacterium]|nr:CDP-alcohol phosphatidyltransferase family protein [Candidatus Nanopelagicaceae bacterium]
MIQRRFKAPVTAFITPICRALLRIGFSANAITVIGAAGVTISSIYFFARGEFFLGTLLVSFFVLSDLFDGTMARISKTDGTRWGALLDSTLDRISDAAIAIGIWIYLFNEGSDLHIVAMVALFLGGLIPYIRAKAESLGIECSVGLAERPERLIILLVGTGLYGLGVDLALGFSLWLLVLISCITVIQRMKVVRQA